MTDPIRLVKRRPANRCTRCAAETAPGKKRCNDCNSARRIEWAERRRRDAERVPTFADFERLVPE